MACLQAVPGGNNPAALPVHAGIGLWQFFSGGTLMRSMLLLASVAAAALTVALVASAAPPKGGGGSFANYSLAETTGTTCPGSAACSNIASEPAIRADGAGRFFGSSENGIRGRTLRLPSPEKRPHRPTLRSPN